MHSSNEWPRLPHLEIIRELGRGTSGVVYLTKDSRVKRQVAVKALLQNQSSQERSRFMLEAQAMAVCRHENIVQLYEIGEIDGQMYYAREFVEGTTLEHHMAVYSSVRDAARIMASLAEAVDHLHGKRIVHRNLSPANVLLTKEGRPKLIGFHRVKPVFEAGAEDRARDIVALGQLLSQMVGPTDLARSLKEIYARCVADSGQGYESARALANDLRALTA